MKKNIPLVITAVIIALGLLVFCLALFSHNFSVENGGESYLRVYFLNPAANAIAFEQREISLDDQEKMIGQALAFFMEGPSNQKFKKTFPPDMTVVGTPRLFHDTPQSEGVFEIRFSKEYYAMTAVEELYFRASLVWTMTELDFVSGVHIFAENQELVDGSGTPMGFLDRENTDIRPQISLVNTQPKTVKLYFANKAGETLLREDRTIDVNPNNTALFVIEQIIVGPLEADHYPTVSPDIKIRDVNVNEGICFVNLSIEFIAKSPPNTITNRAAVYSIVNSLTELPEIKKVQFFIESDTTAQIKGDMDLSAPLERDDTMIADPYA